MKIKFWGVRGSLPSPASDADLRWKIEAALRTTKNIPWSTEEELQTIMDRLPDLLTSSVGGNTSCVEVRHGDDLVILDAGSGLKALGREMVGRGQYPATVAEELMSPSSLGWKPLTPNADRLEAAILVSHTHWDHIQGFPYFSPAFMPGVALNIYGADAGALKEAFQSQQVAPAMFPLPLAALAADIQFKTFPEECLRIGEMSIASLPLPHPGGSLAYKISAGGRSLVYATDYEFTLLSREDMARLNEFIRGADVLINDSQYTYLESVGRQGWGHSTSFNGVDLALQAGAEYLYLFHHDPDHSDLKLHDTLEKTLAYHQVMSTDGKLKIRLAVEGQSLDLNGGGA